MYKICKTKEASLRQREFESCLLKCMSTTPYNNISVTDLCSKVGIARKNFYRYFENKEDVLCALLDHTLLDYSKFELSNVTHTNSIYQEILHYLSYWESQEELLDALSKNNLSIQLLQRFFIHVWNEDTVFLHFAKAQQNISNPNTALFIINGIFSLIITWHHSGYQEPKEQLANTISQLLTQPLIKP